MSKKYETRGRPLKEENDKFNYQIHTRLTKRQYLAWKAYADKQGKKEADVLRDLIEEACKTLSVDDLLKTMEIDVNKLKKK